MITKQYKKKWSNYLSDKIIVDAKVEEWGHNAYHVKIIHGSGGTNSIGIWPFENDEEKNIAFKLASQYAKRIKAAQKGLH